MHSHAERGNEPKDGYPYMLARTLSAILFLVASNVCFALDAGISSSGKDLSLDLWSDSNRYSNIGFFGRLVADFKDYTNGDTVRVCNDGSVSGASGSGTCSGHGGISHEEEAQFNRVAIAFGPTYSLTDNLEFHGGFLIGFYNSNINIGDESKLSYSKAGINFGLSLRPIPGSGFMLVVSNETEQERTSVGFRISI